MSTRRHIATYALYGFNTGKRVGTGYIYDVSEIPVAGNQFAMPPKPLRLRWRNEECKRRAMEQLKSRQENEA